MSNGNHHETVQVEEGEEIPDVNYELNRFPCAVVYQPFPPLTWLFPLIGESVSMFTFRLGRVHDFQGPYTIIQDRMPADVANEKSAPDLDVFLHFYFWHIIASVTVEQRQFIPYSETHY
eukprot:gene1683-2336_t